MAKATRKKATSKKATRKKTTAKSGKAAAPKADVAEIPELLVELGATEDAGEKRRIRAKLRQRGHVGGLRDQEKPAAKKATRKKTTRRKPAAD